MAGGNSGAEVVQRQADRGAPAGLQRPRSSMAIAMREVQDAEAQPQRFAGGADVAKPYSEDRDRLVGGNLERQGRRAEHLHCVFERRCLEEQRARIVFALVAYATIRGILAPARNTLMAAASSKLSHQTMPLVVGAAGVVVALAFVGWRRVEARHLVAGALIGLLVPAGYFATAVLGHDDFEPATVESMNVTRSGGDALVYLLIWTGAKINFGIAFVGGILVGAALVAVLARDFKLVGFERPHDMLRYALGAALMGTGGVLALGCTIGNGLTGIASLAPTSFIALPAMVVAAAATMKWRKTA